MTEGGGPVPTDEPLTTLEGVLERIVFANEDEGWLVVRIEVPGRADPVTAVGNLLGAQIGESLRLRGRWVENKKYGLQFRIDSFTTLRPSTVLGIERYLGSGLIPGIGKVMASRLVQTFGIQTLDVIDDHPDRLTEVDGIGPVRAARIRDAWVEQRGIRDVMIFLQSHGVSAAYAVRIYKKYGSSAIAVVRENPYRLALDIIGIGFLTADRIAEKLGVPRDSPARAQAGILHALGAMSEDGHVHAPQEALFEAAEKLLAVPRPLIETAVAALAREGHVVIEDPRRGRTIALESLHTSESGAAARLAELLRAPVSPIAIDAERALVWFEAQAKIRLDPRQREAVERSFRSKLLIITGGPGTGKTTLVNGIIRILEKKSRRILLCAPTGRAAKRLSEATGREARTIHRMLEYSPKSASFERNLDRPLEADMVIVDEVSMVDIVLFHHLLKALPVAAQLILVGDADQLPSVGPGAVLADLIASGRCAVVRLDTIFRQDEESRIVVNAHRINRGEFPILKGEGPSDFYFMSREEPEEILETVKGLVSERIPRRYGLDPLEAIQVIVPMHRGTIGARNLNAELQALLNPEGAEVARGARIFRTGDRVMQIRNNYDLDVYNGDIGRVAGIDPEEQILGVRYETRIVNYPWSDLDELVLAYACSVHKSQGSEYPVVIIPLHTQHYVMLERNLLYTAVTRGKKLVVIVGSAKALSIAVRNRRTHERHTRLAERLVEALESPAPVWLE